jgi:hypothetical protein
VQAQLPLSALLSKALIAIALEYEQASAGGPALDRSRSRRRGGLERHGLVQTFSAEDGGGGLWVRLTDRGRRARVDYGQRIKLIDQQWQARYGPELRTALEAVVDGLDLPCRFHPPQRASAATERAGHTSRRRKLNSIKPAAHAEGGGDQAPFVPARARAASKSGGRFCRKACMLS